MKSIHDWLREWRQEQAQTLNVPPYFILSNAHLAGVALACPTTMEELAACPGMGPKRLAQFGAPLLDLLLRARAEGLEPGVEPPGTTPLSDEEVAEIATGLRLEAVRLLSRRFRGRFTALQLEEALTRAPLFIGAAQARQSPRLAEAGGGSD